MCPAPGTAAASARVDVFIQPGLLPPFTTRTGCSIAAHCSASIGSPKQLPPSTWASYGKVCAIAFIGFQAGISFIIVTNTPGSPMPLVKKYLIASLGSSACRSVTQVRGICLRLSSTTYGGSNATSFSTGSPAAVARSASAAPDDEP